MVIKYKVSSCVIILEDINFFKNKNEILKIRRTKYFSMQMINLNAEIYGLPKSHKAGISLRPIIFGLGSTPRIIRSLAKISTPLLGTISNLHVKNSGNLLNKIDNINIKNKSLASQDIKSLYTNISVNKCIKYLENHFKKMNIALPLPVTKIIKLCIILDFFFSVMVFL